ncbi:MAG TPA: hypothetical protein VN848_10980 [Gemmatimonadales bacterium]|nr:hypothetical protein [Gemmatimonadales bacterium]
MPGPRLKIPDQAAAEAARDRANWQRWNAADRMYRETGVDPLAAEKPKPHARDGTLRFFFERVRGGYDPRELPTAAEMRAVRDLRERLRGWGRAHAAKLTAVLASTAEGQRLVEMFGTALETCGVRLALTRPSWDGRGLTDATQWPEAGGLSLPATLETHFVTTLERDFDLDGEIAAAERRERGD